jgi:hypothetical protein
MIPPMTQLNTFGPACTALFISQVITGCDPIFTLRGAFSVCEWEGDNPCLSYSR